MTPAFAFVSLSILFLSRAPSICNAAAFTLCASGHVSPNEWMAGKTTYFRANPNTWTTLYSSYNHPPETPNTTYIFEDFSSNESCWSFGVAESVQDIIDEQYSEFGLFSYESIPGRFQISSVPHGITQNPIFQIPTQYTASSPSPRVWTVIPPLFRIPKTVLHGPSVDMVLTTHSISPRGQSAPRTIGVMVKTPAIHRLSTVIIHCPFAAGTYPPRD